MGIKMYKDIAHKNSILYKRESLDFGDAGWYSERGISKDLEHIKYDGWMWDVEGLCDWKTLLLCPSELTEW